MPTERPNIYESPPVVTYPTILRVKYFVSSVSLLERNDSLDRVDKSCIVKWDNFKEGTNEGRISWASGAQICQCRTKKNYRFVYLRLNYKNFILIHIFLTQRETKKKW